MSTPSQAQVRRSVAQAQTMVVKVGSSSLTRSSGHLDAAKLEALVASVAANVLSGARIVLVSSGAIAAGFGPAPASPNARATWPPSRPPPRWVRGC